MNHKFSYYSGYSSVHFPVLIHSFFKVLSVWRAQRPFPRFGTSFSFPLHSTGYFSSLFYTFLFYFAYEHDFEFVKFCSEKENNMAAKIRLRSFIHSLLWTKEHERSFPPKCCRFALPVSFHQCHVLIQTLCCVILLVDIVVTQHFHEWHLKGYLEEHSMHSLLQEIIVTFRQFIPVVFLNNQGYIRNSAKHNHIFSLI